MRNNDAQATLGAIGLSQAIIEFQPDGTILTANANFLKAVGYTLAEVQGQHHSLLVEPSHRDSSEYHAFWDALRCGTYRAAEFKRIAKDGREVWIQASYNPVRDRSGRVSKIIKIASDITAQKTYSLDLDGQIAALHRSQAVISFTPEGIILDANANFLATMGYDLEEVRGRHHSMFVDAADRTSDDYRRFWAALAHGEFQSAEFRRIAKGSRLVFIQATYNPITGSDGRVIKVVKFATDVTAQVLERQRRVDVQRAISGDLDAIGQAVEDVTQQTADAAATVGRVSDDIQAVAAGAEELSASVGEISQQVCHASRMAGEAVEQTHRTGSIVASFSDRAVQIGDVLAMISGIARQTNLLALNATIEAARAGVAG
ncbi:PAS domain-containing methyl-accepting chemotaxis protein, partial [Methylobacterium sp. WL2]